MFPIFYAKNHIIFPHKTCDVDHLHLVYKYKSLSSNTLLPQYILQCVVKRIKLNIRYNFCIMFLTFFQLYGVDWPMVKYSTKVAPDHKLNLSHILYIVDCCLFIYFLFDYIYIYLHVVVEIWHWEYITSSN